MEGRNYARSKRDDGVKGMIAIVDCGTGNLASVENAFRSLGADASIASAPEQIQKAQRIVLPGVGSFGYFMEQLRANGLEAPIKKAIAQKKPYLGICLGMQVLFEKSAESPGVEGLGVFAGEVVKFRAQKVPQVGWNRVLPARKGILKEGYAYFTNSYYCKPREDGRIAARSDYSGKFACGVEKENIFAVQFHPERSGKYGLELLRRWVEC